MRQELDNLFEAAWTNGEKALDKMGLRAGKSFTPAVDVVELEDAILVDVDLPGIDPQKIDVALTGNMLTISGVVPERASCEGMVTHVSERPRGAFSRSIPLPSPVNADSVVAEARHGTLNLRLAKQQSARPRHIQVKVKSEGSSGEQHSSPLYVPGTTPQD